MDEQWTTVVVGVEHGGDHPEARRWADEHLGDGGVVHEVDVAALLDPDVAEDVGASAVVVGSVRSRRGSTVGRLPERIAERSTVPTVVVPDVDRVIVGDVVLAVDEPLDEQAVQIAVAEARSRRRRLTLLRAWEMPVITRTGLTDFVEDPMRWRRINVALLERVTAEVAARFPDVRVHPVLAEGRPGQAITTHTREACLVVLGQGHVHVLGGSVLHEVVRGSLAPVCVVPASTPAAGEVAAARAEAARR